MQHNSIVDGKMVPLKVHDQPVDKSALIDCTKKRGLLRIKQERMKNEPEDEDLQDIYEYLKRKGAVRDWRKLTKKDDW